VETHRRSLVKAATYRLFATTIVFAVAFVHTGNLAPSAKIGLSAAVAKTLLYYVWERLWSTVDWGVEA